MDSWQGRASNPTTLNKYLYANANPTYYTDPSGYMSLGGMMAGLQSSSNLTSTVIPISSNFSRLFSRWLELRTALNQNFSGASNFDNRRAYSQSRSNLIDNDIKIDRTIESLMSKSGILLHDSWGKYLGKNAKKRDRYVIYLPSSMGPYFEFKIKKVGSIDIKVVNDSSGTGGVTGIGVGFKNEGKAKQIWRMDHHEPHIGHNPHGDYSYFIDSPFHHHISKSPR